MTAYARPSSLDQALKILSRGGFTILAGGTDHYPARVGKALTDDILDLSAIGALRGITQRDGCWRLGAATTWTELIEAKLPPLFDGLKLAAREVGGVQIQNRGTIAGNVCNASPAADGIPPLLALDAQVEVASTAGIRLVALHEFLVGNRRTLLARDELATALIVNQPGHAARSHFLKLGTRKYLVISIVMAAATIECEAGKVRRARVAVGACSPVARRLPELEAALEGRAADRTLAAAVTAAHLRPLAPIDDVRASRGYRSHAALELVKRTLDALGAGG